MLVDFIRFLPLPLHELWQVFTGNDVESLAELMVHEHRQDAFDKTVRLEHVIFQLLQTLHLVAYEFNFLGQVT